MRTLIHVGHPKTASTWLQTKVFCESSAGFCIPWPDARGMLIGNFVTVNAYRYDPGSAREAFAAGLEEASTRKLVPVLSDETLCGSVSQRRYDGREVATRLNAAFPEARILVCVREQRSMVRSLYAEYIRQQGVHTIDAFIGTGSERVGMTPICRPDFLEYDLVVGEYQNLFGTDGVLVLPFEALRQDPRAFLATLQQFSGAQGDANVDFRPQHTGSGRTSLSLRRPLNRLAPLHPLHAPTSLGHRALAKMTRLVDRCAPKALDRVLDKRLAQYIDNRLAGCYGASNRRLAAMCGLDLADMGYDVS